jgi:hypothetical protein
LTLRALVVAAIGARLNGVYIVHNAHLSAAAQSDCAALAAGRLAQRPDTAPLLKEIMDCFRAGFAASTKTQVMA